MAEGPAPLSGAQGGPGDEVAFVLVHNPKVNDLNARRVRCTLKAAPCPETPGRPEVATPARTRAPGRSS